MPSDNLPAGTDLVTRRQWGALPPSGAMATQHAPTEAFVHYSDSSDAEALVTGQQRATAVRQIQRFHMHDRGWSDIGYHYVVFQPAYGPIAEPHGPDTKVRDHVLAGAAAHSGSTFKGRVATAVPAAQAGHNTGTLAICVYAGPGDPIRRRTLFLIESIIFRYPTLRTVGAHRDVTATDCPGAELFSLIPRIAKATHLRRYA